MLTMMFILTCFDINIFCSVLIKFLLYIKSLSSSQSSLTPGATCIMISKVQIPVIAILLVGHRYAKRYARNVYDAIVVVDCLKPLESEFFFV